MVYIFASTEGCREPITEPHKGEIREKANPQSLVVIIEEMWHGERH